MIMGFILIGLVIVYVLVGILYGGLLYNDGAEDFSSSVFYGIIWLPFALYIFYKLRVSE